MTKAQWVFEYLALLDREREDRTFNIKALRTIIVHTFGLDIPNKLRGDEDTEAFTPLVMMAGNHHLLKTLIDEAKKSKDDNLSTDSVISDREYEEQLKRMEDGMEPIEGDPFANQPIKELLNKRDAQLLGVKVQEEDALPLPDAEPVVIPAKRPKLGENVHPIDSFDLSLLDQEGTSHSRPKTRRPMVQDEE
jgi:hypothetical protein